MKVFAAVLQETRAGRACAVATVVGVGGSVPRTAGARMLVRTDGTIEGTIGGGAFEHRVIQEALLAIQERRPRRISVHLTRDLGMCCGGAMEAFVEPVLPTPQLVIYGAGHVAQATASIATQTGFDVTVVDDRPEWNTDERFPAPIRRIERDPLVALPDMPHGPDIHHLIVTHSHQLDQDLLANLIERPSKWLGLIGSRSKVAKFLIRLRAAGTDPTLFHHLSSPVGLDIGAETPEEIAISILAELVRVRRGCERPPVPLSEGRVHLSERRADRAKQPTSDEA